MGSGPDNARLTSTALTSMAQGRLDDPNKPLADKSAQDRYGRPRSHNATYVDSAKTICRHERQRRAFMASLGNAQKYRPTRWER